MTLTAETTHLLGRAYDKDRDPSSGIIYYRPNPNLAAYAPDLYSFAPGWGVRRINQFLRDRESEAYEAYHRYSHDRPGAHCPGCGTQVGWHDDPHCRYLRWTRSVSVMARVLGINEMETTS